MNTCRDISAVTRSSMGLTVKHKINALAGCAREDNLMNHSTCYTHVLVHRIHSHQFSILHIPTEIFRWRVSQVYYSVLLIIWNYTFAWFAREEDWKHTAGLPGWSHCIAPDQPRLAPRWCYRLSRPLGPQLPAILLVETSSLTASPEPTPARSLGASAVQLLMMSCLIYYCSFKTNLNLQHPSLDLSPSICPAPSRSHTPAEWWWSPSGCMYLKTRTAARLLRSLDYSMECSAPPRQWRDRCHCVCEEGDRKDFPRWQYADCPSQWSRCHQNFHYRKVFSEQSRSMGH